MKTLKNALITAVCCAVGIITIAVAVPDASPEDAAYVWYAAKQPTDWTNNAQPGAVSDALDELGSRTTTAESDIDTLEDRFGVGTDHHLVRWDGTTGLQDSGITVDDSDNLSGVCQIDAGDNQLTINGQAGAGEVYVYGGTNAAGNGGAARLYGGTGSAAGGNLTLRGGEGEGGGGGVLYAYGGQGSTTGGAAYYSGGPGLTTGGAAYFQGGMALDGTGGHAYLRGGLDDDDASDDGNVVIGDTHTKQVLIGNGTIPINITGAVTLAGSDPDFGGLNLTNVGNVDGVDVSGIATAIVDADFDGNGWMARTAAGVYEDRTIGVGTHMHVNVVGDTYTFSVTNIGIADDDLVEVDDAGAADDEYCRFTADGIEGRAIGDMRSDLDVEEGSTADQTGAEIVTAIEGENAKTLALGGTPGMGPVPMWYVITVDESDYTEGAAMFEDIVGFVLPASGVVHDSLIVITEQAAGTGTATLQIGPAGGTVNKYTGTATFNWLQAANTFKIYGAVANNLESVTANTNINFRLAVGFGTHPADLTAGTANIFILISGAVWSAPPEA